jgi:hypothetical protein
MPNQEKSWPSMSQDEKLDALRDDIARLFRYVNGLTGDMRSLSVRLNAAEEEAQRNRKKE